MKRKWIIIAVALFLGWWVWGYFFPGERPTLPQSSTVTQLSDAEITYYKQVFDYTMAVTKPGEKYEWQSYNGNGYLKPDVSFISKSGATCRNFSEEYTIGVSKGYAEGVACKRDGKDGWCRLKKIDAMTCAMERAESFFDYTVNTVQTVNQSSKDALGGFQDWMR